MEASSEQAAGKQGSQPTRRGVLLLSATMAIVAGAYALLASMAVRFLYPARGRKVAWQFVETIDRLPLGKSLFYTSPTGAQIVVARQNAGDTADSFVALSSICPHLGCAVHWESQNARFFCPCHNGAFDAQGVATAGPPAAASQVLERFPLKVAKGRLLIEVPMETINGRQGLA
jgi:Rieske Fe-S protein